MWDLLTLRIKPISSELAGAFFPVVCISRRCLLLGRETMTNLDSIVKSKGIPIDKVLLVKAMVFPGMHPTPVFLPGESHGQRSLMGYRPPVAKNRTQLSDFTFTFMYGCESLTKTAERQKWILSKCGAREDS